jgi:hypothetical protein
MWVDLSETRIIREMLRVLQGSCQSYKTGYFGSITERFKKCQWNRKAPEAGTEHDFSQPRTSRRMQIRFFRKERETANLLAQQGNSRAFVQTV